MYILNVETVPVSDAFKDAISYKYKLIENIDELHFDATKIVGLYCRFSHVIDANFLHKYSNLQFIMCNATGTEHIDHEYCSNHGICVIDLSGAANFLRENVTSSAEHSWCLLLAVARNLKKHQINLNSGIFDRNAGLGVQLKGKGLGIVGLGRNGLQLANFAESFQMKVRFYDPYISNSNYDKDDNLPSLFSKVDFAVLSVKLNSETRFMVDSNALLSCKGMHLINTSRGEIVVESDVIDAVESGKLLSYATDVLSCELNYKESKVYNQSLLDDRILVTPHVGGATHDAWSITELYLVDRLKSFIINNKKG